MIVNNQDFEQIKAELIDLYIEARKYGDAYVMNKCDYILQKLQNIENAYIRRKYALKNSIK